MDLQDLFSNSATVTGVILAILVMVMRFHFRRIMKSQKYHPIGSTIFRQRNNFQSLHDFRTELARKHKTYRALGLFRSVIHTVDPANVECILKTNFANYGKRRNNYNILTDLLGDGIFTVDGEKWHHQRKLSSHELSSKSLRDYSTVVFKTNAVKLALILSGAATSNQSVDIQHLFLKSTLDSVFQLFLGVELDIMCGTFEEGTRLSKAFDKATSIVIRRYVDYFWKIKRYLNVGSEALLRDCIKEVDGFIYKIIERKMQQVQKYAHDDLPAVKKDKDILSGLLELKETDTKCLRDILLSLVIAGKDTTSSTLSWFFYMMCSHPDIQEKIAKQVIEATQVSDNSSIEELASSITEKTLDKMQYLHAALTETLRLYPAVPTNGKICFSDDTLPDGFKVKKRQSISYLPYAMGRMKCLWGDDAEEFRPARWLDGSGRFQPESPFKFTAFQAGHRICLGKEFAYRQMKIFCMLLLGCFRFKLSDEDRRVKYRTRLTLQINGGLHLLPTPRLIHV